MSKDELRALKVGDRVKLTQPAGPSFGTVVARLRGCPKIAWDDTALTWVLNPQAKFDRERALNITKLEPTI